MLSISSYGSAARCNRLLCRECECKPAIGYAFCEDCDGDWCEKEEEEEEQNEDEEEEEEDEADEEEEEVVTVVML